MCNGTVSGYSTVVLRAESTICQGGEADHGEHGAQTYKGDLGSESPAGSWGRAPAGGQQGETPLKLKAFVHFRTKQGPKDKDLNETI